MALRIRSSDFELVRAHGEEAYPRECCGVLVGEFGDGGERTVHGVVRCGNARMDSPEKRYSIDPAELIRVQREARMGGRNIVGFYHSHPDWPARWSSTDLDEAHWTECSYVITSIEKGKAAGTSSFLLRGGDEAKHFEEEAIEVI
ncbi:MAG: M67 family metallopeptidase [Candidatus Korobacteraceae bacterium]